MPTYDYKCTQCAHEMEAFQGTKDEPLKQCPQCQGDTLRRRIGGGLTTLQFKGSGFYKTDYCKKEGGCSCKNEGN